jgi:Ser/Thr protein kinase RdoA (MazF antagonist)
MTEQLGAWVDEVLGGHSVVERLPSNTRKRAKGQRVRAVTDPRGRRWILKEVAVAAEWEAETHALAHWAPALAGRVPTLHAAHAGLRSLVMSEVRGRHPRATHEGSTRQAGALLRRFHDSAVPRPRPAAHAERSSARIDRLLTQSRTVLGPDQHAFAREQADRLAQLPLHREVPCHGDYRPHNWLVDETRTLRVIDFGKSRYEVAAWDLAKLFLRPWWNRAHLAEAFLEGYGRGLLAAEADYVQCRMAVDAVSHVAFGAARGSDRHVRFGCERLADLVGGHRVTSPALLAT